MNLIKQDIAAYLPDITWSDFTEDVDGIYYTTFIPQIKADDVDAQERYLRLRGMYPSEFVSALVSKLPNDCEFIDYNHLDLTLRVRKDA